MCIEIILQSAQCVTMPIVPLNNNLNHGKSSPKI
jgi:hypothetical protein